MILRYIAIASAALLGSAAPAAEPIVRVCLERHSDNAKQARFRVVLDWNGYTGVAERFDIGAEDANNDIWPQLRDERLQPQRELYTEFITISDVSRYPLSFHLMRFTDGAARAFDDECRDGFCSVKRPLKDIEIFGSGATIPSVAQAPRCEQ